MLLSNRVSPGLWPLGGRSGGLALYASVVLAFVMACTVGCGRCEVAVDGAIAADEPRGAEHEPETNPFAPGPGRQEKTEGPRVTTEDLTKYPNEEYHASIVQVLAHRDRYHGKEVQVMGYLRVQFEGTAIYLSKEDADYGITRNGFWVTLGKGSAKHDQKYVLIEGTFDKDEMGHLSLWQGTIKNVTRVVELTKHD